MESARRFHSIAMDRPQRGVRVTPIQWGIAAGVLAVAAGSLFGVRPPENYGLCVACHARDLVNWTINTLAGSHLTVAQASQVLPVLTTIGLLLGGLVGAWTSGEFRWRMPDQPLKMFVYGVLVMNFALLAAGCSIRLVLRAAAGEALGLIGLAGMIAGAAVATLWLRWNATR
jgi:hypothetical protein